jgi:uncharacterized membrane protein
LLENSLPLSGNTSAGANVLLQGVDPDFEIMRNIAIAMQQVTVVFVTGHIDTK